MVSFIFSLSQSRASFFIMIFHQSNLCCGICLEGHFSLKLSISFFVFMMLSSESKYIQVFFRVETTPQLLHPFTFTAGWELRFFTSSSSTAWRAILNSSLYLEIPCWNFSFSLVQSSLFVFLQISEKGGCSSNAFVQGSILLWAKEPTRSSPYPLQFLNWCEYSFLLLLQPSPCPPSSTWTWYLNNTNIIMNFILISSWESLKN